MDALEKISASTGPVTVTFEQHLELSEQGGEVILRTIQTKCSTFLLLKSLLSLRTPPHARTRTSKSVSSSSPAENCYMDFGSKVYEIVRDEGLRRSEAPRSRI
jgi:hypothetical protein